MISQYAIIHALSNALGVTHNGGTFVHSLHKPQF